MEPQYDYFLVLASVIVAFFTSFLAIAFASFIVWHKKYNSLIWTGGAAFNMGMGVWSMHFVGMMAVHIDTPLTFEIQQTVISALAAVLGCFITFKLLLNPEIESSQQRKLLGATILGSSVLLMHYLGMDAMNMFPPIQWDWHIVGVSAIIAYAASYIGLEIFVQTAEREKHNVFVLQNILAAIVVGSAVSVMHYVGMSAANFADGSYCATTNELTTGPITWYILASIGLILTGSFALIIYEQGVDTKRAYSELENINDNLNNIVQERTKYLENAMETLQQTQDSLVESEKMASLGGLVAGVAHEVNTPLGVGLTSSTLLREHINNLKAQVDSKKLTQTALTDFLNIAQETSTIVEDNLHKAADLIASFKQLAVDQSSNQVYTFNLNDSIRSCLDSLNHKLKKQKIDTELICPTEFTTYNNAGAFSQIVTNIIVNASVHAFDDSSEHPKLSIHVTEIDGDAYLVTIKDNGVGMPKEVQKNIFEPFFTTKRGQGGSGLGMHLVYNLANKHLNGSIKVESEPGKGSGFFIQVPKQNDSAASALY